jgi:hypothetical protein
MREIMATVPLVSPLYERTMTRGLGADYEALTKR